MKKFIPVILFTLIANLTAQNYNQLLDTNTVWSVEYSDYIALPPTSEKRIYMYEGDIVIDTTTYKDYGYGAILREDTMAKKVYLRNENLIEKECLLYNFAAEQGDTVEVCDFQIFIDSVSLVVINNGEVRKIFYYSGAIAGEYYIEGVGSNLGFVELSEAIGPPSIHLICVKKGEISLWGQEGCGNISVPASKQDNESVKIIINSAEILVNMMDPVMAGAVYKIYDMRGGCVKMGRIKGTSCILDISSLSQGEYIINLINNDHVLKTNKFIKE